LTGLVESQNLERTEDPEFFRIGPRTSAPAERPTAEGHGVQGEAELHLFVIRLKHARAADVAATVNLLFRAGGEFSGHGGLPTPTLSDELRRNVVPPTGAAPAPAGVPTPTPGAKAATLSGPVTIVPDQLTNSLLVRASQPDYDLLQQAVGQLD